MRRSSSSVQCRRLAAGLLAVRSRASQADQDHDQRAVYPLGFIFDKVYATLKTEFEKANPDHGQLSAAYKGIRGRCANGAAAGDHQAAARRGVAGDQPPALFVDRKIAVDLTPFIERRIDRARAFAVDDGARHLWRKALWAGLRRSRRRSSTERGSLRKAGAAIRRTPATGDGIFDLAKKVNAPRRRQCQRLFTYPGPSPGNWMRQALVFAARRPDDERG